MRFRNAAIVFLVIFVLFILLVPTGYAAAPTTYCRTTYY
ncbi:MAG: hypothetical protein JWN30_973 [Bacilli bacterium]|nr:hypothetical protein [Bacilli bacterium]